jgi:hypothetical protein
VKDILHLHLWNVNRLHSILLYPILLYTYQFQGSHFRFYHLAISMARYYTCYHLPFRSSTIVIQSACKQTILYKYHCPCALSFILIRNPSIRCLFSFTCSGHSTNHSHSCCSRLPPLQRHVLPMQNRHNPSRTELPWIKVTGKDHEL